ncbi:MAG: hypothetical protein ISQ32_04430 [Rickettsiales bacterium]|nr:hypothetical protein [Rickettsiales bacterium]
MPTKSQNKVKKSLIICTLIVTLLSLFGYLAYIGKDFLYSKVENKMIELVEKNGYRVTYDSFEADNIFAPSKILISNVTLRKINSDIRIETPNMQIAYDSLKSSTVLKSAKLFFTIKDFTTQNTFEIKVSSEDDTIIDHHDKIFNIQLPTNFIVSGVDELSYSKIIFDEQPFITYSYNKHDNTDEIIDRSISFKSNIVKLFTDNNQIIASSDFDKLYFSFNNMGFNRFFNLQVSTLNKLYDENQEVINNLTTNFGIDLVYRGTLNTGVSNSLKLKHLDFSNGLFNVSMNADIKNTEFDVIPSGFINIKLEKIAVIIGFLHESIVTDDVSPRYIKNPKFHTIYNMQKDEFELKARKFADYLSQDPGNDKINLEITREFSSMIFINKIDLSSIILEFNKIFFSDISAE